MENTAWVPDDVLQALIDMALVVSRTPQVRDTCPELHEVLCATLNRVFSMRESDRPEIEPAASVE